MNVYGESRKVVWHEVRKLEGIQCDICEKVLRSDSKMREWPKYYRVRTGHEDWGNDSCESIEHKDICPDCIDKFVSEYLKNGSKTAYIEIETDHVYCRDIHVG